MAKQTQIFYKSIYLCVYKAVNSSNNQITLPQESVAIVAVNQIMKDPGNAPMSQGGMTVEERGGGVGMGNINNIGNIGSNKTL
jgi:hypothetical protein